MPSPQQPPALSSRADTAHIAASREQRLQAGIIDHTVDSTLWIWLAGIAFWCALHLEVTVDMRAFIVLLTNQFPRSISLIGLLLIIDLILSISRGQSLGQLISRTYKYHETHPQTAPKSPFTGLYLWLHGLISRCLGLPLLLVCIFLLLCFNPSVSPIHLQDFSLLEPRGAALLLLFLLKIISVTLLLFALFIPAGLGFIRGALPTWYDRLLHVHVLAKTKQK